MKAIVQNAYGSPDVLEFKDVDKPVVKEDYILVRAQAAALNAGDYFILTGSPWLVRLFVGFPKPKSHILGWDVAGHFESVGENVKRFRPGDEVFGLCGGTLAEYACAAEDHFAMKPANLTSPIASRGGMGSTGGPLGMDWSRTCRAPQAMSTPWGLRDPGST